MEKLVRFIKKLRRIISNLFSKVPIPITLKVTLWYGIFLAVIFTAILASLFFLSDNLSEYSAKSILVESVSDAVKEKKKIRGFRDGVFISIINDNGDSVKGSLHPDFPLDVDFSDGNINKIESKGKDFLYYDVTDSDLRSQGQWIRGVVSLDTANLIAGGALVLLSIIFPIAFIFIIYFGYRIIKKAFVPVESISNLAIEIGNENDLSKRIEVRGNNDEIQKMSVAFNKMLENLEMASLKEKQFTSDVSHELRTPVSVIQAESEYALEFGDSIEETKESLEVISRQSGKMGEMINQLLSLSRMDKSDNIKNEDIDVSNLVRMLIKDQDKIIHSRDINIMMDVDDNLIVNGDKLLLQRAFMNLISNAVKFTNSNILVSVKSVEYNLKDNVSRMCKVSVEDNGHGIPLDEQSKVWDRFYQSDISRNTSTNSGAGLGLSIVKQIAEMHGGQVFLESEVGKGSTFSVLIPLK